MKQQDTPQAHENSMTSTTNRTSRSPPVPTVTVTTSTTSCSTVSAYLRKDRMWKRKHQNTKP